MIENESENNGMYLDTRVKEKSFRNERFYVKIDPPINGHSTVAHAVYVWLKENPVFTAIPKGYVIHHLDGNKQNDDVSNLALMNTHHHFAHHVKHQTIKHKIIVYLNEEAEVPKTVYYPIRKPKFYEVKGIGRKVIRFRIVLTEMVDGKQEHIKFGKWKGNPISSREMAERIVEEIWSNMQLIA